jgi:hypothetical protein
MIYNWALLVLVTVDGLCLLLTVISWWRIAVNFRELEKVFKGVSKASITAPAA